MRSTAKKTGTGQTATARPKAQAQSPAAQEPAGKKGPKGITVVTPKPQRRTTTKRVEMPRSEPLLKPGGPKWKPLIPSGPSAANAEDAGKGENSDSKGKARLTKRELDKYRKILLKKRDELLGDISNMETEALRGSGSGSLSHTPQHMAEQGSDAYDQSLSLDLAAVDRKLLTEIDEALERIESKTYGVCELSGVKIRPDRLEELPWTRYSIEAARELERRSMKT